MCPKFHPHTLGGVYTPVDQQLWDQGQTGHPCRLHTLFRLIKKKHTHIFRQ